MQQPLMRGLNLRNLPKLPMNFRQEYHQQGPMTAAPIMSRQSQIQMMQGGDIPTQMMAPPTASHHATMRSTSNLKKLQHQMGIRKPTQLPISTKNIRNLTLPPAPLTSPGPSQYPTQSMGMLSGQGENPPLLSPYSRRGQGPQASQMAAALISPVVLLPSRSTEPLNLRMYGQNMGATRTMDHLLAQDQDLPLSYMTDSRVNQRGTPLSAHTHPHHQSSHQMYPPHPLSASMLSAGSMSGAARSDHNPFFPPLPSNPPAGNYQ